MPTFEFYKASNLLNESRIFIRDLKQTWYQTGLPGISKDINGTVHYLNKLILDNSPDFVTMVGNSMGGFAALLFSNLVGKSRAIAFVPQTFISPMKRLLYRDWRWRTQIFQTYKSSWRKQKIWDLAKLIPQKNWNADIYVSTQHRLDYLHASNLQHFRGVSIHGYENGGHMLVRQLRDSGELAEILKGTAQNSREH